MAGPLLAYRQVDHMVGSVEQARLAIAAGDYEGAAALLSLRAMALPGALSSLRDTARLASAASTLSPTALRGYLAACLAAGTPIRCETGSRPIESLRPGDRVWARPDHDPGGILQLS